MQTTIEDAVQAAKALKIEPNVPKDVDEYTEAADKMQVGESVFFTNTKDANRLCRALEKKHGQGAFSTRTVPGGFRVWRDKRAVTPRKKKDVADA